MRIERREVPARPGRDPATQRRVLEALREVPQRQPMLLELLLQSGPCRTGLDPRRQRLPINLQHSIQPLQVKRHHRPLHIPRLDPTNHARPAPERHDNRPLGLSPLQHHLDLRLVPRISHQIRRIRKFPPKPPHHIPICLPQRMHHSLVVPLRKQIPKSLRSLQPPRSKLNLIKRYRLLNRAPEAKPLPNRIRRLATLLLRGCLVLVPPAPVLAFTRQRRFPRAVLYIWHTYIVTKSFETSMSYPLLHPERGESPPELGTQEFRREFPEENQFIEFKSGVGHDQVQETAVAFSNADGGVILAGVADDGTVLGRTFD